MDLTAALRRRLNADAAAEADLPPPPADPPPPAAMDPLAEKKARLAGLEKTLAEIEASGVEESRLTPLRAQISMLRSALDVDLPPPPDYAPPLDDPPPPEGPPPTDMAMGAAAPLPAWPADEEVSENAGTVADVMSRAPATGRPPAPVVETPMPPAAPPAKPSVKTWRGDELDAMVAAASAREEAEAAEKEGRLRMLEELVEDLEASGVDNGRLDSIRAQIELLKQWADSRKG